MRSTLKLFLFILVVGCLCISAQVANGLFVAKGLLPSGYFVFTSDDGPAETTFAGQNNTLTIAQNLHNSGVGAAFFMVTCHFGQGTTLTPACPALESEPLSILDTMASYGDFVIGNHTRSHINLTLMTVPQIHDDVALAQQILAPYQQNLGLRLFRCPYLICGPAQLAGLREDPVLSRFTVVDADVKVLTEPNGTVVDVDWDCWILGVSEDACSDMYIQQMQQVTSGFVLTHNRTPQVPGYSGDVRPVNLASMLVSKATAAGMQFVAPDAVPGLLGNVRATGFTKVSAEFGSSNGDGPVVFADITGNGLADACKAFGHTIRCMIADGKNVLDNQARSQNRSGFLPSTLWMTVDDPGWVSDYGRQFWLVDFDGHGKSALVLPGKHGSSNGFWVAPSDGTASFGPMSFWPMHFGGWTSHLLQTVRFADINGDGLVDVVAEVGGHIVWSANVNTSARSQNQFGPPKVLVDLPSGIDWSNPAYGSTLLVGDVNGDGHPDLVVRGSADVFVSLNSGNGKFPDLTSWSRRFPDSQGWSNANQYATLAIATIGGNTGLAGGASTGIVFHQADAVNSKFTWYRYLNNEEFSVVPGWHPDGQASQLSFAHLAQGSDDWPVLVKDGGLFVAPVVVQGDKTSNQ